MNDKRIDTNVKRAVAAASVGTVIEWFDYALYGAASGLVINKLFFPTLSPAAGILAAFATFAVGYFVRPIGGVVISHIGDKYGRKPALILTITMMGAATVAMGFLPTFAQIGLTAPILLVLLRMFQGFGAGAELAGAIVLVAEYVPRNQRAFYTAIPNAATLVGIMLATAAFLAVSSLQGDVLLSWGWRVPFLLSGGLFVVALYIRKHLDETPEFVAAMENAEKRKKKEHVPMTTLLKESPKEVVFGFLSVSGHNANIYILSAFVISYLINTVKVQRGDALLIGTVASLCGIAAVPLFGLLADRLGSAKIYMLGAASIAILAFPLFAALNSGSLLLAAIAMALCYVLGFGAMAGAQGAFLANLFPTRYRFSGLAVSRELNGVLVAGPTPLIASALVSAADGRPTYVALYLIACCTLSIIAIRIIQSRSIHE
ncbi:MAG TPA: MFS transporter [Paraburkholderia sp.]|uniref:MFS transporter n=1 Tax=Paraburkholderia sp. TaxID=1926495 RepID=UPI002ED43B30